MALTFLDLVNEVLNYGFNDGPQVNRQRVQRWINEAQYQIARQVEAPEFQTNATITLIPGQASYTLPADFARVQDIVYPGMYMTLRPVDIKQFDFYGNTAVISGPPDRYALDQGNLFLFPTPDTADTLTLRYIAVPAALVNDTDVPVINQNYVHLLVYYALKKAFASEDDYEAAQYFETEYKADLDAYATDVQFRDVDRPRVVDGTWGDVTSGWTW